MEKTAFYTTMIIDQLEERHYPTEIPTPLDYFFKYFPENEYQNMANYTNTYAEQTDKVNWISTNAREKKICVDIHLLMGVFGLPCIRMYKSQKESGTKVKNKYCGG